LNADKGKKCSERRGDREEDRRGGLIVESQALGLTLTRGKGPPEIRNKGTAFDAYREIK